MIACYLKAITPTTLGAISIWASVSTVNSGTWAVFNDVNILSESGALMAPKAQIHPVGLGYSEDRRVSGWLFLSPQGGQAGYLATSKNCRTKNH